MNKIVRFDRQVLSALRQEILEAIQPLKEKYGLRELEIDYFNFKPWSFSAHLIGSIPPNPDDDLRNEEARFFAQYHGLPEDILTLEFSSFGKTYAVDRIEVRNPKYPIIAFCKEEERFYKFSVDDLKAFLSIRKD
jgi:hypothetical protein